MRRIVDYPRASKLGWRRFVPSWRLVLGTGAACFLLGVIGFAFLYHSVSVPDPNKQVLQNSSVVYWSDGKTELGRFGDVNRESVPLAQMPQSLQKAVLSAEDRSFYQNKGFSPRGYARAVWVKVRGGSTQGGSTITQQYVKNYFLNADRSPTRKAKELVIALKIEKNESKDKILENYLNTIYFGRGAYGVQAASRAYFGVDVSKLNLSQSALLASIVRSPGLYDPVTHKDNAQARMDYVLSGMVKEGWATQEQSDAVKFPKIAKRSTDNRYGGTNGYLLNAVRSEVVGKSGLSDADIDGGGLRIVSTFDRKAQEKAVQAVKDEMPKDGAKGVGVGLVAVKPGDGAVVAMYGGADAIKRERSSATQDTMQAGSTFKPFTLAAALEDGVSLKSSFNGDSPKQITIPGESKPWTVSNFSAGEGGTHDLIFATEHSVNTIYAQLNEQVGPDKSRDAAIAAGYPEGTTDLKSNFANVLGTASPRVIDVATAYATFAAQGMHAPSYMVKSVTLASGEQVFKAQVKANRAFDAGPMADLTYALQNVVKHGTGSFAASQIDRPLAGKTGTAQDAKSAWFAGYTPQLATAVGLYRNGKDKDGHPVQLSLNGLGGNNNVQGASFPLHIWTAFMKGATEGMKVEQFPAPVYGGESNSPTPTATATATPTSTPTRTPTSTPTVTRPTATTPTVPTPTLPTVPVPTGSPTSSPTTGGGGGGAGSGGGGSGGNGVSPQDRSSG
ncbi:transglycosylase domain-containing protein [Angustibacter sp. McL0619]|uniref:transglycosylase domain-containing protein n=1 Tax=Angustibacter sp. McL0619 TaxID=3415676 RepID=UPI003CE70148